MTVRRGLVAHLASRIDQGGAASVAATLHEGLESSAWESEIWYAFASRNLWRDSAAPRVRRIQSPQAVALNHLLHSIIGRDVVGPRWPRMPLAEQQDRSLILHVHYLHSHLGDLSHLSRHVTERRMPVVWTMHDFWLLTGRCATPNVVGCERYLEGCGSCPHRSVYPPARVDLTRHHHARRRKALRSMGGLLHLVAPSASAYERVLAADLGVDLRVIENGISPAFLAAVSRQERLGRSADGRRVAVMAADLSEPTKVPAEVWSFLAARPELRVRAIGRNAPSGLPAHITSTGYLREPEAVAAELAGSDVLLLASAGETFGLAAAEAMAAGCYVVAPTASGVGGTVSRAGGRTVSDLGEALDVVSRGEAAALFESQTRWELAERARRQFSSARMIDDYLRLYDEIAC